MQSFISKKSWINCLDIRPDMIIVLDKLTITYNDNKIGASLSNSQCKGFVCQEWSLKQSKMFLKWGFYRLVNSLLNDNLFYTSFLKCFYIMDSGHNCFFKWKVYSAF